MNLYTVVILGTAMSPPRDVRGGTAGWVSGWASARSFKSFRRPPFLGGETERREKVEAGQVLCDHPVLVIKVDLSFIVDILTILISSYNPSVYLFICFNLVLGVIPTSLIIHNFVQES